MAKFTYRMQSILNIQYQLETQAKMELGRAQMRLMEEEEKQQRLIDRKEAYLEEGRKMRSDKLHVNDLKDNRNAMLMIEAQRGQVALAQKAVEAARLKLQEVMQERKMHEKLKEKAFEQFMSEENAAEGKAVDELTSYTYGQRGKGE